MPDSQVLLDDLKRLIQKADKLHQDLSALGSQGIKPFYSNIRTVAEHGQHLLILGINPGGGRTRQADEERHGILRKLRDIKGKPVSAFLDEEGIEPGNLRYQSYVREMSNHLPKGNRDLRQVPFANICPLRTPSTKGADMHARVWLEGCAWGLELIQCLRPRLLLCLGNGDKRSSWGALRAMQPGQIEKCGFPQLSDIAKEHIHGGTQAWKEGRLNWTDVSTTMVLALAHPQCNLATRSFAGLDNWLAKLK